jgi:hypothetical protein
MSTDLPKITERRQLSVGSVEWTVSVFNGGESYMLVATASPSTVQFSAHFDAQQWAEFQRLVAP